MSGQGCSSNDCHTELAGLYPGSKCSERVSGTRVLRVFFLKVGQKMFRTVCCPET